MPEEHLPWPHEALAMLCEKLRVKRAYVTSHYPTCGRELPRNICKLRNLVWIQFVYLGSQKSGPQKREEFWRNKERVPFRAVAGRALLLKSCKRLSSCDPVVNGCLVICAVDWNLGRRSRSHPGSPGNESESNLDTLWALLFSSLPLRVP